MIDFIKDADCTKETPVKLGVPDAPIYGKGIKLKPTMVNERQGKVYNPRPVYNRKLLRSVIRAGVQKQFGQHHVSANMAGNFEKIRKERVK